MPRDHDWPSMPDGREFDGKQLLTLVRSGNSPFHGVWDVSLLIREVEESLGAQVIDIPAVYKGSNNFVGCSLPIDLCRIDVNMPGFEGMRIENQIPEVKFEVAAYELLRSESDILASRLLHHRIPVQHVGAKLEIPQDIAGRRLLLFERAEGENNVWEVIRPEQKVGTGVYCPI